MALPNWPPDPLQSQNQGGNSARGLVFPPTHPSTVRCPGLVTGVPSFHPLLPRLPAFGGGGSSTPAGRRSIPLGHWPGGVYSPHGFASRRATSGCPRSPRPITHPYLACPPLIIRQSPCLMMPLYSVVAAIKSLTYFYGDLQTGTLVVSPTGCCMRIFLHDARTKQKKAGRDKIDQDYNSEPCQWPAGK